MAAIQFPDPRKSTREGIVAVGGELNPEMLLTAYRSGIFPWPIDDLPLTWFCPPKRGVLEFDRLKVPRSLAKERARSTWSFTIDRDFPAVIRACAKIFRGFGEGTWITEEIVEAYERMHSLGHVHSVEVWEGEELVGGLYGVEVDGVFAGESMFHRRSGASKLALLHLIDHLRSRGAEWIDTQTPSPLMSLLGGRTIPRDEFLERLQQTQRLGLKLFG
jgi:leucyl/phenylalanyl-tRNA--protein transferase